MGGGTRHGTLSPLFLIIYGLWGTSTMWRGGGEFCSSPAPQSYFTSTLILIAYWTILSRRLIKSLWETVLAHLFNFTKEDGLAKKPARKKVQRPHIYKKDSVFVKDSLPHFCPSRILIYLTAAGKPGSKWLRSLAATERSFLPPLWACWEVMNQVLTKKCCGSVFLSKSVLRAA